MDDDEENYNDNESVEDFSEETNESYGEEPQNHNNNKPDIDSNQNIRERIESLKKKSIDFSNFESEYDYLFTTCENLNTILKGLYLDLETLIEEEQIKIKNMRKLGIDSSDVSSKAWKPLSINRQTQIIILVKIRDVDVLKADLSYLIAFKFKSVIEQNKGMILQSDMAKNQIALTKLMFDGLTTMRSKDQERIDELDRKRTDLYERSIGNMVAMVTDIKSERTKSILEKCEATNKEINNKTLLLEKQEKENEKQDKDNVVSKEIIEKLNKEIIELKKTNVFNEGFINKINEREKQEKERKENLEKNIIIKEELTNEERINNIEKNFIKEQQNIPNNIPNTLPKDIINTIPNTFQPVLNISEPLNKSVLESIEEGQGQQIEPLSTLLENNIIPKNNGLTELEKFKFEAELFEKLGMSVNEKMLLKKRDTMISTYTDLGENEKIKIIEKVSKKIIAGRDW